MESGTTSSALDKLDQTNSIGCLRELDAALKARSPLLWERLRDDADELYAAVGRVLSRVCADDGSHVVVASETELGDGATGGGDRYLTLLCTLVERAAAMLGRRPGEHTVHVMPLQRTVLSALVPGHRVAMNAVEMNARLATVRCPANVTARFHSSPRWNRHMESALVLADFAANRARKTVPRERTLEWVERETASLLGVAVRVDGRSNLTASGLAREIVLTSSIPGRAGAPGVRRWAIEQAKEWRS